MVSRTRIVIASALAPLVVPTLFLVFHWAVNPHAGVALVLLFSTAAAYVGLLVLGLPAAYGLYRIHLLNVWYLALAGMFGGVVVMFAFLQVFGRFLQPSEPFGFLGAVWGATLGLLVALVFCALVGITRRSSGRRYRAATYALR